MTITPIFIPSKGRVNNCSFIKLLHASGFSAYLVVEQEDLPAYQNAFPLMVYLVLPESSKGITYVRNYIKKYTEDKGFKKYWMFDDDITALYRREGTKMVKSDFSVLEEAEAEFEGQQAAIGALDYQQIAWSATKNVNVNTYAEVAVCIDNTRTFGLRYREEAEGKEDRDFVMQIIREGQRSARTTLYCFGAPANGSNAGGLKEMFYDQSGREELCCDKMVALWGEDICQKRTKPNGRIDLKIHWNRIKSNQISLF